MAYAQDSEPAAPLWQPDPARTPAENGLALFSRADQANSGFGDLEVSLTMILRSKKGSQAERSLRIRQLEMPGDGDRVLVVFDTPVNVRGTALLSHGHKTTEDDQWLFLPALQRVKKIASRNKSGPFLGSEFSFEDLAPPELEKYTYHFDGAEVVDGQTLYVATRYPTDEFSGYAREVVWLDPAHLRVMKIDYYDRRDHFLKTLEVSDYALYQDRFWKAGQMLMTNARTGKSTALLWQDYRFGREFSAERDFSVASLRRAR